MKIRIGIVGLGDLWETRYRPALRSLSDRFEVKAVCADVPHLAQQAARDFNADDVDGFRILCQRSDIEAVLMLSTNWFGPLPVYAACEAGKSVFCTAPFDGDLGEADEVRTRVQGSGVSFVAEFARRHAPATLRLKELIATRLGKPRLVFCHRRAPMEKPRGPKRKPDEVAAAARRDMMELVDWCRYVVGYNASSVFGVHHIAADDSGDDYQMMNLDFSAPGEIGRGPTAQVSSGRYIPASWPEAASFRPPAPLQVACENGIAFVDLPSTLTWFDAAGRHMETLENERPVGEALLLQFHRSVTSLVRKVSDLDDAYHALQVVDASQLSADQGKRIMLQ
jgi:predicted dehydrogenase